MIYISMDVAGTTGGGQEVEMGMSELLHHACASREIQK